MLLTAKPSCLGFSVFEFWVFQLKYSNYQLQKSITHKNGCKIGSYFSHTISLSRTIAFFFYYPWGCSNLIYHRDWILSSDYHQKQPPEVFYKKSCSEKFCNIHRKAPVFKSLFKAWNFIKNRLQHSFFTVNIAIFLRTPNLKCIWVSGGSGPCNFSI